MMAFGHHFEFPLWVFPSKREIRLMFKPLRELRTLNAPYEGIIEADDI
jgi:hypothetical protein